MRLNDFYYFVLNSLGYQYNISSDNDHESRHNFMCNMCIFFGFMTCLFIFIVYACNDQSGALVQPLVGMIFCALSLFLSRRHLFFSRTILIIGADSLVFWSYQHFNGLLPSHLYFIAIGAASLVLFQTRQVRSIFFFSTLTLILGVVSVVHPTLLKLTPPAMSQEFIEIATPVIWTTAFFLAIAPSVVLFHLSRSLQQKIMESQAERVHKSRLQSLGELAAGVAHEINNPLAVVIGKTDALLENFGPVADNPQLSGLLGDLKFIEKNSLHIAKIVKTLQIYSRHGEGDALTRLSVFQLIDESKILLNQKIETTSCAVVNNCDRTHYFVGVHSQLLQAVSNLILNAIDAVSECDLRRRKVTICSKIDGQDCKVLICDEGPGIPAAIQPRIFEPFYTTKPPGRGTGLGLGIVKNIAQQHKGRVSFKSNATGTVFVLEVPGGCDNLNN